MAKISIHLDHPLIDGEQITFRSPCASATATGLKVYRPTSYEDTTETSTVYTLKDAAGTTVHSKTGLFASGAYVTVTLDTTNAIAYVQNAATTKIESDLAAITVPTAIPSNSNLNSYTTPGLYYATIPINATLTNSPAESGFIMFVYDNGQTGVVQIIDSDGLLYSRVKGYSGGNFGAWVTLATNAQISALNTSKLDKTGHSTTSKVVVSDGNGTITPYADGPSLTQLYAMRDLSTGSTLQTQIDSKLNKTGHSTVSKVVVSDGNGEITPYADGPSLAQLYAMRDLSTGSTLQTQIDGKAQKSHSSTGTTYGVGTSDAYGHLKIANNLTTASFNASAPVALSAYQGKVLNDSKAPNDHASTDTTYGVGNQSYYGHVKLIDALTSNAYTAGEALSAYQGAVLKAMIDALTSATAIASGGNLNSYTTTGHFYAANASTAAGITNSPTTSSGYTLHVFPHGASGCYQQAEDNSGNVYARVLPSSGGTWTAWKTLS